MIPRVSAIARRLHGRRASIRHERCSNPSDPGRSLWPLGSVRSRDRAFGVVHVYCWPGGPHVDLLRPGGCAHARVGGGRGIRWATSMAGTNRCAASGPPGARTRVDASWSRASDPEGGGTQSGGCWDVPHSHALRPVRSGVGLRTGSTGHGPIVSGRSEIRPGLSYPFVRSETSSRMGRSRPAPQRFRRCTAGAALPLVTHS